MNTDDISKMWAGDSPIDETNLVGESKRIPQLHSKYYNLYFREVLRVKKLKAEYKEQKAYMKMNPEMAAGSAAIGASLGLGINAFRKDKNKNKKKV